LKADPEKQEVPMVHGGSGVVGILVTNTKPFIIYFKNASEKVCEWRLDEWRDCPVLKKSAIGINGSRKRTNRSEGVPASLMAYRLDWGTN